MKIFISWSGSLSQAVATLLKGWLEDIFQGAEAWMSNEDINKGAIWFSGITDTLEGTDFGILCLTSENTAAPWILFEAGALSKGLTKNRVCPLLVDLEVSQLEAPLSQFNAARPVREDMWRLVKTINSHGKDHLLLADRLRKTFDRWWDDFETKFGAIIANKKTSTTKPPKRTLDAMVVEILEIARSLQEKNQQPPSLAAIPSFTPTFDRDASGRIILKQLKPLELYLDALKESDPYDLNINPSVMLDDQLLAKRPKAKKPASEDSIGDGK